MGSVSASRCVAMTAKLNLTLPRKLTLLNTREELGALLATICIFFGAVHRANFVDEFRDILWRLIAFREIDTLRFNHLCFRIAASTCA